MIANIILMAICFFAKSAKAESDFTDSYLIGCSEHFYNGITPFSAGGQPFQIYYLNKRGITKEIIEYFKEK